MDTLKIGSDGIRIQLDAPNTIQLEFHKDRGLVVYNPEGLAVFTVYPDGSMRANHIVAQGNLYLGENTQALNLRIDEMGFHARDITGEATCKVLGQQSLPVPNATPETVVDTLNELLRRCRDQGWLAPSPGE